MDAVSAGGGDKRVSFGNARVDIVIVNWNSGNQLLDCLKSVQCWGAGQVERVVIVDNASSDGSSDGIDEQFDMPHEVIRNDRNRGFAAACNQGARLGNAPYLLFLNPDARLLEMSLPHSLQFMDLSENHKAGICGIQLLDENGKIAATCARFPTFGRFVSQACGLDKAPGFEGSGVHMRDWDHSETRNVDHVIGAFFLVRRSIFVALHGFDERFFVYLEDIDFSFRAQKAGWSTVYLADAQAFHAGGGTSRQVKAARLFYSLRSRLMYGFKHFTAMEAWLLAGVTLFVEPVSRLTFCAARRDWGGIVHTLQGYRYLWRALPQIAASRGNGIK